MFYKIWINFTYNSSKIDFLIGFLKPLEKICFVAPKFIGCLF